MNPGDTIAAAMAQRMMKGGGQPRPGGGEVLEQERRIDMTPEQAQQILQALGITPDIAEYVKAALEIVLEGDFGEGEQDAGTMGPSGGGAGAMA